MRAAADRRFDVNLVVEHAANPVDDRQPQAEPARNFGALLEAVEFLEHGALA
jgi:hypothetical protein